MNPEYFDGSLLKGEKHLKAKRKGLKPMSEKQALRQAFLKGVYAERMRLKPWCERCGEMECDVQIDLHHTIKRSQGPRWSDGEEYGVDNPALLTALCRKCHRQVESNPEWGTP